MPIIRKYLTLISAKCLCYNFYMRSLNNRSLLKLFIISFITLSSIFISLSSSNPASAKSANLDGQIAFTVPCPNYTPSGAIHPNGNVNVTVVAPGGTKGPLNLTLRKSDNVIIDTVSTCPPEDNIGELKTTFFEVPLGDYKVCFKENCTTFSRTSSNGSAENLKSEVTLKILSSELGSINKSINVTVKISIPLSNDSITYGPYPISLMDASGKVKQIVNTSIKVFDTGSVAKTISLVANFNNVAAGNDYKVCTQGASPVCSDKFNKTDSTAQTPTITIPADKLTGLAATSANITNPSGCSISGIGWIICPVIRFLGSIADGSFRIFDGFLQTSPELLNTDSGTYKAWEIMRSLANVVFVIAFLIIIFSQLTSVGITNYGVKKLLPRLIIAAILVNLSYFICQILVDFSNITGQSLKSLLDGIANQMPESPNGTWNGSNGWTNIIGGIISVGAGVAIAWASLATLIPAIISVVIAFIMILFILAARQALIVLLIVISPLAFVAFLLPNTEQLFKKWRTTLLSMLLLFPIISVVYGVSTLASGILSSVLTDTLGQIIAASLRVLPLFIVPSLLKKSLDGVGNIGGTINSIGGRIGGGLGDKYKNSGINKYMETEKRRNQALTRAGVRDIDYTGKNPLRQISKLRSRTHGYLNENMGRYGANLSATGVALADQMEAEDIKASSTLLDSKNLTKLQMRQLATGGNVTHDGTPTGNVVMGNTDKNLRAAAIQKMVATNDVRGINEAWDTSSTWDDSLRQTFASSLQSSSTRPAYITGGALEGLRQGGTRIGTIQEKVESAINTNIYSAEKIATADKDELSVVANVSHSSVRSGRISSDQQMALIDNATRARTDPMLSAKIGKNAGHIEDISTGSTAREPLI